MNVKKIVYFIGSVAMMGLGFKYIPSMIQKLLNKKVKHSVDDLDIDSMGPEIVKKSEEE